MMKQKYMKPMIAFERFALTQSVASGCAGVPGGAVNMPIGPTHWNATTCAWNSGGLTYFTSIPNCTEFIVEGETVVDGYCYNNPNPDMLMFGS